MVQATQFTRFDEGRVVRAAGRKLSGKAAWHTGDGADVDRERILRELLDEAHERIRLLEKTVELLKAAL